EAEHQQQHEQQAEMEFNHDEAASSLSQEPSMSDAVDEFTPEALKPFQRQDQKVGRNDPCPCGSGKKFKQCHGKLV
ncbi:MAG TPA: hypothetical protein EYH16_05760, partial [Leucothrix mucor]|nr:hypothetical protein [Leucothrix mucor]